jgi:hypothetical protein
VARAKIYNGDTLLDEEVHEDGKMPLIKRSEWSNKMPLIKRSEWSNRFTFLANSPDFNNKVVEIKPDFLDNKQLLTRVVEGAKLGSDRDKVFYHFDISPYYNRRDYHNFDIPTDCTFQLKGDPVTYHIEGLPLLLDSGKKELNRNLFAEFWLRKDQFESSEAFKEMYDLFAKIRPEVEKAESIHDRSKVFERFYREYGNSFKSNVRFRQEYTLFEQIARRAAGLKITD